MKENKSKTRRKIKIRKQKSKIESERKVLLFRKRGKLSAHRINNDGRHIIYIFIIIDVWCVR